MRVGGRLGAGFSCVQTNTMLFSVWCLYYLLCFIDRVFLCVAVWRLHFARCVLFVLFSVILMVAYCCLVCTLCFLILFFLVV